MTSGSNWFASWKDRRPIRISLVPAPTGTAVDRMDFGATPERNTVQWDHAFPDGTMFQHGNMGRGIYVDPKRGFCGM